MWTERGRSTKRRAAARGCIAMREFSPARCSGSAARPVVPRRGDAIATRLLAAIERSVGDLEYSSGELALAGRDTVEAAQPEARGDADILALVSKGSRGDAGAQLAGHIEGRLISGFGKH